MRIGLTLIFLRNCTRTATRNKIKKFYFKTLELTGEEKFEKLDGWKKISLEYQAAIREGLLQPNSQPGEAPTGHKEQHGLSSQISKHGCSGRENDDSSKIGPRQRHLEVECWVREGIRLGILHPRCNFPCIT